MAGERVALPRHDRQPWSSERIARELVPLRDQLVARLGQEIAAARDLTLDQRELVIDDAIDFMVTEYAKPVETYEALDRAFWAAASFRVKRAFEGRSATVRGGYRRVDIEDLDRIAGGDDPEEAVVRRDERLTLLEFATMLSAREREVLACKYGTGPAVLGRKLVSRALGLPIGEVRKAEREIARKLDRFATLVAAGSLCSFRGGVIGSLAAATASDEEAAAARLHLLHCPACRRSYAERVHAIRTGELQRELAGLLPIPIVDRVAQDRPLRGVVVDWLSRPSRANGQHSRPKQRHREPGAGSGPSRRSSSRRCVSAVRHSPAVLRSASTSSPRQSRPGPNAPQHQRPAPAVDRAIPIAAGPTRHPKPHAIPTPERPAKRGRERKQHPTAHETAVTTSPPPSDAQADGIDEFGPTSASQPTTPASAPATGAPEFP